MTFEYIRRPIFKVQTTFLYLFCQKKRKQDETKPKRNKNKILMEVVD